MPNPSLANLVERGRVLSAAAKTSDARLKKCWELRQFYADCRAAVAVLFSERNLPREFPQELAELIELIHAIAPDDLRYLRVPAIEVGDLSVWLRQHVVGGSPVIRDAAIHMMAHLTDDRWLDLIFMVFLGELSLSDCLKTFERRESLLDLDDSELRKFVFTIIGPELTNEILWRRAFHVLCLIEPAPVEMMAGIASLIERIARDSQSSSDDGDWDFIESHAKLLTRLLAASPEDGEVWRWFFQSCHSDDTKGASLGKAIIQRFVDGSVYGVRFLNESFTSDEIRMWAESYPKEIGFCGGFPRNRESGPSELLALCGSERTPPNPFFRFLWPEVRNGRCEDVPSWAVDSARRLVSIMRGLIADGYDDNVRANALVGLIQIPVTEVRTYEDTLAETDWVRSPSNLDPRNLEPVRISHPLMSEEEKRRILRDALATLRHSKSPVVEAAYGWANELAGGWVENPAFWNGHCDDVATWGELTIVGPGAGCLRRPELITELRRIANQYRTGGFPFVSFSDSLYEFLVYEIRKKYDRCIKNVGTDLWHEDNDRWWKVLYKRFLISEWRRFYGRKQRCYSLSGDVPTPTSLEVRRSGVLQDLMVRLENGDLGLQGVQYEAAIIGSAIARGQTVTEHWASLMSQCEQQRPREWRYLYPHERQAIAMRAVGVKWNRIRELTGMSVSQHDQLKKLLEGNQERKNPVRI